MKNDQCSAQLDNITSDYITIIETELQRTTEEISHLLQNSNCSLFTYKLRSCTSGNASSVHTLHNLTCKMRNLPVPETALRLIKSVLSSMRCPCSEKSIKTPTVSSERRRGATRRRRNEGTKKLCKAKAILSAMTECYEMLNSYKNGYPNPNSITA